MKKLVAFLFCTQESEFEKWFQDEFLNCQIKYRGILVTFASKDFGHICYEAGKGGVPKAQFGVRRARRLLVVKQILTEEVPADLLFEENTGNYCLLCEPLDIAVFLIPVQKDKTLQIGTIIHYGDGFTKRIKRQRESSKEVSEIVF